METSKKINIGCSWPVPLIVFLAFFFAKIFDKIDWSWWWIFSPLWIPTAIIIGLIAIFAITYLIIIMIDLWK